MSHARTPWYPFEIMPARVGVYERNGYGFPAFQFWDGRHWIYGGRSPRKAIEWAKRHPHDICPCWDDWRGLKQNPTKEST